MSILNNTVHNVCCVESSSHNDFECMFVLNTQAELSCDINNNTASIHRSTNSGGRGARDLQSRAPSGQEIAIKGKNVGILVP